MVRFVPQLETCLPQLAKRYGQDLDDLRDYVKIDFSSELLSDDFHQTFYKLLFSEKLDKYGPLKYYWLKMVEDFFYILELHYDEEDGGLSDDDQDFTDEEREEEILSGWQQTSFASALEGMLEEGLSPMDASMALIPLMESQILAFAYLHFYPEEFECETAFLYNMSPEFGDYENRLNLLETHQCVEFETALELFPAVPISEVDYERKLLGLDNNGETDYLPMTNMGHSITVGHKHIYLLAAFETKSEKLRQLTTELQQQLMASSDRQKMASSQLSFIVLSDLETPVCSNLPEVIHLNSWKNTQELEKSLDLALASLACQHMQMAWDLTTEDDVEDRFTNPLTGKKDLLQGVLQDFLPKFLAGQTTENQVMEFKKLYQKVKSTDLVPEKVNSFLNHFFKA